MNNSLKQKIAGHLVSHRRSHSSERPFACEHCKKTFVERGNMLRHMKKHHPDVIGTAMNKFVKAEPLANNKIVAIKPEPLHQHPCVIGEWSLECFLLQQIWDLNFNFSVGCGQSFATQSSAELSASVWHKLAEWASSHASYADAAPHSGSSTAVVSHFDAHKCHINPREWK